MPINRATRQLVRTRSNFLCEYCHSSEAGSTAVFTFDHILPQSLNGSDDEENLALACIRCNGRRYNFTTAIEPETQTVHPLFNPRNDKWALPVARDWLDHPVKYYILISANPAIKL
jgi:5-methylcytosine-specific restriction endonuclease McrA